MPATRAKKPVEAGEQAAQSAPDGANAELQKSTRRKRSTLEAELMRQINQHNLPDPITNYRFHPKRRFEIDFAWPAWKVGVEAQGGIWIPKGAHSRPANILRDAEKVNEAQLLGWTLLLIPINMTRTEQAIEYIRQALTMRGWQPGA